MAAEGSIAEHLENMVNVGYPLIVARIDGLDAGGLRNAWDILRGRMPEPGACVIGTINNDKPVLMAAATDEAVAAGFNAGNVIKAIAGNIKGGATLEYTATSQTVKDDKGRVSKTIVTEEDVKLKTGLITWSPAYLQALIETARVTETGKSGQHKHRTYKLGGLANKTGKRYLYRFVHTRDDGRKLRITVTGKNSGTISIAFQNDNPTQVDAEVTAQSLDSDGTLVIMDDELTENAT